MKKQLLFLVSLLLMATSSWALIPPIPPVYVNGTTGSDSWDGSSATYVSGLVGPKATVQAGIGAVSSGGTVNVASGSYSEVLTVSKSLTLSGEAGQTMIDGTSSGRALAVTAGTVAVNGLIFKTAAAVPTIDVSGGSLKIRNCIIHEAAAQTQACLYVSAGSVDAGTTTGGDYGHNRFFVHGTGNAIDNAQAVALPAEYNDWGSAKGPTIGTNTGGDGGAITGTSAALVDYSPWGGGPVTTVTSWSVCTGTA
ncbi:MAG: hypothetical protein WCJ26_13155 [bacterium]